jgi:hypothetical protein
MKYCPRGVRCCPTRPDSGLYAGSREMRSRCSQKVFMRSGFTIDPAHLDSCHVLDVALSYRTASIYMLPWDAHVANSAVFYAAKSASFAFVAIRLA